MKQIKSARYTSHREVWLLLPWHVNRSLGDDDKQLVEDHLKVCLPCRGELINQRILLSKVSETTPFQIAGQAAFSSLQKRINLASGGLPMQKTIPARFRYFCSRIIEQFSEPWSQHRVAFALSALLIVLTPLLISEHFLPARLPKSEFRTLSNPTDERASVNDIRIVFARGLLRKQMDEILAPVNGRIADGPSPNKVFRVRIENPRNGPVDLGAVIAELRKNNGIVFAEPLVLSSLLRDRGIDK